MAKTKQELHAAQRRMFAANPKLTVVIRYTEYESLLRNSEVVYISVFQHRATRIVNVTCSVAFVLNRTSLKYGSWNGVSEDRVMLSIRRSEAEDPERFLIEELSLRLFGDRNHLTYESI
jgi:hypothetical protein